MSNVQDNNYEECVICLSNSTITHFVTLSCGHAYHHSCITRWIEWNNTPVYKCPQCQTNITKEYCSHCSGNLFPFDRKVYACGHKYHITCANAHSYINCLGISTYPIEAAITEPTKTTPPNQQYLVDPLHKQPHIITRPTNYFHDPTTNGYTHRSSDPLVPPSQTGCITNVFNFICRLPCAQCYIMCCEKPD